MNETDVHTSKDRLYYEGLVNSKSTIVPIPKSEQMRKRWKVAQSRSLHTPQKALNALVEQRYHQVLTKVKQLISGTTPIFERDYRHDSRENALAMHAFIGEHIYLYLECDYSYKYQVEYTFHNCPFEHHIRAMLFTYPLDTRSKVTTLKPDFTTFYENVLRVQDRKYITY